MFLLWRHAESLRERAEWERARAETAQAAAEAEFRRTSALLAQLIELNAGVAGGSPGVPNVARKIDMLRTARLNLVELADRLPDRQAMYSQLMTVDERLGGPAPRGGALAGGVVPPRDFAAGRRGRRPAVPPRRLPAPLASSTPSTDSARTPSTWAARRTRRPT